MPDTPQADAERDQNPATAPAEVAPLRTLPARHAGHQRPSDWHPTSWIPIDPEVLLKVRTALQRL